MSDNSPTDSEWKTGTVKFFSQEKGFGFIEMPDGKLDVFLHAKQLRQSGILTAPKSGDKLRFKTQRGEKGFYASNVSVIDGCASC